MFSVRTAPDQHCDRIDTCLQGTPNYQVWSTRKPYTNRLQITPDQKSNLHTNRMSKRQINIQLNGSKLKLMHKSIDVAAFDNSNGPGDKLLHLEHLREKTTLSILMVIHVF